MLSYFKRINNGESYCRYVYYKKMCQSKAGNKIINLHAN